MEEKGDSVKQLKKIMIIINSLNEYEKWISIGRDLAAQNNSGFIVINKTSKINQTIEELDFIYQSIKLSDKYGAEKVFNIDVSLMKTIIHLAEIENVSYLLFPKSLKFRLLTLFFKNLSLLKDSSLYEDAYLFEFKNKTPNMNSNEFKYLNSRKNEYSNSTL